MGIKPIVGQAMREEVEATSIPDHDPVIGLHGPLPRLWRMMRNKRVGLAKL